MITFIHLLYQLISFKIAMFNHNPNTSFKHRIIELINKLPCQRGRMSRVLVVEFHLQVLEERCGNYWLRQNVRRDIRRPRG